MMEKKRVRTVIGMSTPAHDAAVGRFHIFFGSFSIERVSALTAHCTQQKRYSLLRVQLAV